MTFLDDVTVLDLTQVVAGSFASMTLADLGADVLKVERPGTGDIGRSNPPFVDGQSSYFASVNRNKRSIAVDLSSAAGRDVILDLGREADVLLENHPPGRLEGFGLGYDDLQSVNDEIIYCSITGFGQAGPYADIPALDMVAQAVSGHMSLTGPPDGPPFRAGLPIGDLTGASYAVQSILAALYRRESTGTGDYIDISMTDALISWLTVRAGYTFATGEAYPRTGNELREFVPYNVYETADGYLAVIVATDRHWRRLCAGIDHPELADDDRFATVDARRDNRDEINELLEKMFSADTAETWFDRLAEQGVPVAPIRDTQSVWTDEHVQARELRRPMPIGDSEFWAINYPAKFREAEPEDEPYAVPDVGEDTLEVLRTVGYDDDRLIRLREAGVIDAPES